MYTISPLARKLSLLVIVVALLALAVACANTQAVTAPTATPNSEPTPTPEPATHTFIDVYGKVREVPTHPERIVAIHDYNGGAQLLSLGAPVIALPTRGGDIDAAMRNWFDLDGVTTVGEYYEPDIEAILALEPDLIVGEGWNGQGMDQWMDEGVQERLEAIAPVVYIDTFRDVDVVMLDVAHLLGPDYLEVYAKQKAEFETLVEELRAVLGDDWSKITASYVARHATNGLLQTAGPGGSAITAILSRMGVNWVPLVLQAGSPANGGFLGQISNERIREFDADLLYVDAYWDQTLLEDPLFQSLEVVKQGQVIVGRQSDGSFWGSHYPNYMRATRFLIEKLKELQLLNTDIIVEE